MNQPAAVPLIVVSRHQEHVEAVNKALRKAGHPVHPTWLPDVADFGDSLLQIAPELVLFFIEDGADPAGALELRDRFAAGVPVLVVVDRLDEATITRYLRAGAQDVVTLEDLERLQLVAGRELRAHRLEHRLHATVNSAREAHRQLQAFLAGSADAIAHVQEGIVVDANRAWLELFGVPEAEALVGTPAMDLFDADAHAAIKGALTACAQGRWAGHPLKAAALLPDGSPLELEFEFAAAEFDGEPAVRIAVAAGKRDDQEMERRLAEAVQCDVATGLLHRRYFVEAVRKRLADPIKGGVRHFAYVEPDKFDGVLADVGVLAGEDFLVEFARLLRQQLQPTDIAGRFAGNGFMVLIERGNVRDVEAWADHVLRKVGAELFQVGARSVSVTCTIGLGAVPGAMRDPDGPASDAFNANRRGREQGGNRVVWSDQSDLLLRALDEDKLWVRHIKSALMENRFRLVQQPIASLLGDDRSMFDVLVRMLDDDGKEVLPSVFLPAAERNDLMKNIDRWVIGASMNFAAARRPGALFVRLSADTLKDPSLPIWLQNQLRATKIDPARIVFQVSETAAAPHVKQAIELREALQKLGFRFALDGFGAGRDSENLAGRLRPDFLKVSGTLMQGLANDQDKQARVKQLVAVARNARAVTIAERVEDANTMAVLWQLGVEFIQGFFVNAPEEVVLG